MSDAQPLTDAQRRVLASAMDRILPPGHPLSADALGAIGYVEWLMPQPHFRTHASALARGLALLDSAALASDGRSFSDCDATTRDRLLRSVHRMPHPTVQRFFRSLVMLTVTAAFCPPRFGGNRAALAWRHIGFDSPDARASDLPPDRRA